MFIDFINAGTWGASSVVGEYVPYVKESTWSSEIAPLHKDSESILDSVIGDSRLLAEIAARRFRSVHELYVQAYASRGLDVTKGCADEMVERGLRLEIACALRVTERTAQKLIGTALSLVDLYPRLLDSLHEGRVTEQHVDVYLAGISRVPLELRDTLAEAALELAEEHPVGVFRHKLRALCEEAQRDSIEERHKKALAERRVYLTPQDDGMSILEVHAPSVELQAIYERATKIARHLGDQEGETRTRDQLRTDVICDLLIDGHVPAHPKVARGIRASVVVTVPALALLDNASTAGASVEGVGPIPLSVARELSGGDAEWMRVLTHPETGAVLSVGRKRYRPPAALRKYVKWRSESCMAPGCTIPASRCDIDHRIAWADGGHTSAENLAPLCEGHHTVKHHTDWNVRLIPDSGGAVEWTSPLGRRYVVKAERPMPTFPPAPF